MRKLRAMRRLRSGKYFAIKTVVDGIMFASKAEAGRYVELRLMVRSGLIENLELQPRFPIIVAGKKICVYIADFRYRFTRSGELITEDVKGVRTPVYRIKKKLVEAIYKITITEVQR